MFDHQLIGAFLESQIGRTFKSWPDAERVSGVSRSTLYRVKSGDPKVKPLTYRRLEHALDLQAGAIDRIAAHRFDDAADIGVPAEIIDWARRYTKERE